MKQTTLSTGGFDKFCMTTRRAAFLAEMDRAVPWFLLCALIEPVYPKARDFTKQKDFRNKGLTQIACSSRQLWQICLWRATICCDFSRGKCV